MADDDVQLTDLEVIQQYSLAVRGATAPRAEVIAALESDLAYLRKAPATSAARSAPRAPAKVPAKAATTKPLTKPATKPATKAAKKAPAKKAVRRA